MTEQQKMALVYEACLVEGFSLKDFKNFIFTAKDWINKGKDILKWLNQDEIRREYVGFIPAISTFTMAIYSHNFFSKNPEIFLHNEEMAKDLINKIAQFLSDNPQILQLFQ
jgi:hypothetical protein